MLAQPASTRMWEVDNPNAQPVAFRWDMLNSTQSGQGVVIGTAPDGSAGQSFFTTQTEPGGNTVRLFVGDTQQAAAISNPTQCGAVGPTPFYAPTYIPKKNAPAATPVAPQGQSFDLQDNGLMYKPGQGGPTPTPTVPPTSTPAAPSQNTGYVQRTINYNYDKLYRLTNADYRQNGALQTSYAYSYTPN